MKKISCLVLFLVFAIAANAWDGACPKREFRATWFQTLDHADFPSQQGISSTVTANQKSQLERFLSPTGHYCSGNLNVCFMQVRPMCDAFYKSSFPEEPWSVYLTGKRGAEPEYDPLAYAIEQGHKGGVAVYAWLNPYRFATATRMADTLATDYTRTHPDWVVRCSLGSDPLWILNPSNPEVRQRVVDVVMDIVNHYDIDGIVFDDYFYQSGYQDAYDNSFYAKNNPHGLNRGDWRREQINLMVKEVSEAIKASKPWVRFGIGPAGVACTSQSVADQYGIPACPSGNDWQYGGIYSDPVNWLYNQYIDFIAPQVYWAIGNSTDYGLIAPWWCDVAYKFGRHAYISQSLSDYGKNGKTAAEIQREIRLNRTSCHNDAPGYVFFPTLPLINTMRVTTLTKSGCVFESKCLAPAMSWHAAQLQGLVTDLKISGSTVSWNYTSPDVKYAVYSIPLAERTTADLTSAKYLCGITYSKSFDLPSSVTSSSHAIAVTVVDRYDNEYAPRFLGENLQTAIAPILTSPVANAQVVLPTVLRWNAVTDAMNYTVQVARDQNFSNIIVNAQTDEAYLTMQKYAALCSGNGTYYWRVAVSAANRECKWSETRSFTATSFQITSPSDGAASVSVNPTFTWTTVDTDTQYKLEIATSNSFKGTDLVFSQTVSDNSLTISGDELSYNKLYYARITAVSPYMTFTSASISFTTENSDMVAPEIISPVNGSTLEAANIAIEVKPTPNNGFYFQLSSSATFPPRSTKKVITARGGLVGVFEGMAEGIWYARVATQKAANDFTDFSDVVCFTYKQATGIQNVYLLPRATKYITPQGLFIYFDGHKYTVLGQ